MLTASSANLNEHMECEYNVIKEAFLMMMCPQSCLSVGFLRLGSRCNNVTCNVEPTRTSWSDLLRVASESNSANAKSPSLCGEESKNVIHCYNSSWSSVSTLKGPCIASFPSQSIVFMCFYQFDAPQLVKCSQQMRQTE